PARRVRAETAHVRAASAATVARQSRPRVRPLPSFLTASWRSGRRGSMAHAHFDNGLGTCSTGPRRGSSWSGVPANCRKEVLEMRNRLLLWLPILTALALAALGAMDWGP